jgi:hydroxymethylbilane synthase
VISTKGDHLADAPLPQIGGKGLFTKEIETALLERRIDLAVHSMKDLPTQLPEDLAIGAVPPRENPLDALVSGGASLSELVQGSRVGTSSLRRKAQLLALRPDLEVTNLRGNVDTRLRRVRKGVIAGAVMACAGLNRLGRAEAITEVFPPELMTPAVGQGALAIEVREDDAPLLDMLRALADPVAQAEVEAERAFLKALGGGCQVPVGALARANGSALSLMGCVCSLDGRRILRAQQTGPAMQPLELGRRLADALLEQGAAELISAIR